MSDARPRARRAIGFFAIVPVLVLAAVVGGAAATGRASAHQAAGQPPPPAALAGPPALVIEAIVTDKKGASVEDLRAGDFEVSVDGERRQAVTIARLYRGPGADVLAASRTEVTPGEVRPLAESSRLMVFVIDQASFAPGDEPRARALAETWLGMLGLSDRVAAVMLPMPAGAAPVSFERTDVEKALRGLRALRDGGADALGTAGEAQGVGGTAGASQAAGAGEGQNKNELNLDPRTAGRDPGDTTPEAAARDQAHAVSTLAGLRQVLAGLRAVPGGKTVFLLSAGLVASAAQADARAIAADAARAQARISVLEVPTTRLFSEAGDRDLAVIARDTGGVVVPPGGRPEQALERMAGQLTFSYLLVLPPRPGDVGPDTRAVRVAVPGRRNLTVLAPALVAPGRLTSDDLSRAPSLPAAPPARSPLEPEPVRGEFAAKRPAPRDAALDGVVARMSQYVVDYGDRLTSVVAEETYTQEVRAGAPNSGISLASGKDTGPKKITLSSDYLLVKIAGLDGWMPFRDVFAVDGQPVRDRQDRLVKLFLEPGSASVALERATAVWQESARYNIGGIRRTINAPLLPLWFLEPRSLRRFSFAKAGEETLSGTRVWIVEFSEIEHPTFIKTPAGVDQPAHGRVWVEPANGRIHRTELMASMATITVNYGPRAEVVGLWLPVTMEERYEQGPLTIVGKASYSKFRQFRVTTDLAVAPDKK